MLKTTEKAIDQLSEVKSHFVSYSKKKKRFHVAHFVTVLLPVLLIVPPFSPSSLAK